jgi:hypothetical protein
LIPTLVTNSLLRTAMDRAAAIEQIRSACNNLSKEMMRLNPAVSALGDKEVQDELYKTIYELTKQLEIVKKRIGKFHSGQDTPLT